MLANYGYKDGSGEYFITIDTDKCNGCGDCVPACPVNVLITATDESDPFREVPVAMVSEEHRKKIKYSCAPCKPNRRLEVSGTNPPLLPCQLACKPQAISHSW